MAGIGHELMTRIGDVTDELRRYVRDVFEPNEGVYRLNDFVEYFSEADWDRVWAGRPSCWQKAWLLADNGQFDADDVAAMTVEEIEAAFDDPGFEPEYAFYTEVDEEGLP
jgi:hypothetical protein